MGAYVADEGNSRFSLLVSQATPVGLNFRRIQCVFKQPGPKADLHDTQLLADCVEKVGPSRLTTYRLLKMPFLRAATRNPDRRCYAWESSGLQKWF